MDLISESSGGTRVVTARYLSAEKSLAEDSNAINTTLLCHSYSLHPNFGSYYAGLQTYAWVVWPCGLVVLLAICALYTLTLRSAIKHWRDCFSSAMTVLAVYPLVAGSAYIVLLIPRARLIAEAIGQQAVMVAMYQLYCMIIAEGGGTDKFLSRACDSHLETRVPPCCCWPCCVIPRPKFKRSSLSLIRYLVLQMPFIQAVLYLISLILWAEDTMLYTKSYIYIQPFVAASILSGVWGIIMCVRAALSIGLNPKPRFLALQLVLIIVKLQCGLAKSLPEVVTLPCIMSLHPSVVTNMIHNSVMMIEMLLLSIWAWRLYSVPPGIASKVQIAVIERGLESDKSVKDGNEKF